MSKAKKEYEIKKNLRRLKAIRGFGTELISIYVPPDFQISDEVSKLKDEKSQSSNIKSKTTRLNVQNAIEKIIQYLKTYKRPPENGFAIFCGNISKLQDKSNIELFVIEPLGPIKSNIYRCDSNFLLEPIESQLESTEKYVILIMDGRDAMVGLLKGTQFSVERRIHSLAHGKVHKGGQSAARYERIRLDSIDHYYQKVGDYVNELFEKNDFKVSGLIIGGPGPTKENFVRAKSLNYQVKILGSFDTGYIDENVGMRELLNKAKELLAEQRIIKEQKIIGRLKSELAREGNAATGYKDVKKALESYKVDILIISEDSDIHKIRYKCNTCNKELELLEYGNERQIKHECGGYLEVVEDLDIIDEVVKKADKLQTTILFVSSESQYGKELLLGFGGIAALLK
ncbi:peptide chain release factor 1 [archaeon]|nr:peptide chain release factor 1 [archaeon]